MIDFLMKSPMPACPTTKRRQYANNFTRHIFLLYYMRLPVLSPAILLAQNDVSTRWHNSLSYFGCSAPLDPSAHSKQRQSLISTSDEPLGSSASSALSTMTIMWDSVQQTTTRDKEMAQLVSTSILPRSPSFPPGVLSVLETSVHCQWSHPLQGPYRCNNFTQNTYLYNPLNSIHQGNSCILAMHHSSYHGSGGKFYPLQTHGTVTT